MFIIDVLGNFISQIIFLIWPFVAIILLARIAWALWMHYIQQDFISGITWTLLEIVPPRDVLRSPKAMELFFTNALYHWSMKGGREEWWQGAVWFWFSLEIASIDGQVHFYIRTPSRIRGLVETQMYAQYPQAQVKEVEDYTLAIDKISPESEWNLWGCEFGLKKEEAYPIKTYVDFGLDKDPKEEFKVDPISSVIELFGSIKKGEQMWMQLVVKPPKQEYRTHGVPWYKSHEQKYHDWVREAEIVSDTIMKPFTKRAEFPKDSGNISMEMRTPDKLKPVIEGIVKKISKVGFETGIMICYVAKKEIYPFGTRTNNSRDIRLIFRQYASPHLNSFERINSAQGDAYGGLICVLSSKQVMQLADRMLEEYRERSFFHIPMRHHIFSTDIIIWPLSPFFIPYKHHETFILNVEELATLWHFPGQIMKVPSLERIESKEASPPTNLPT